MNRVLKRGLLCVAALLLLAGSTAQAQTLLRWKFEKDQQYKVVGTQRTEVETSINGKAEKAFLEVTMELTWHIDEVDAAGLATMTQTFTRLAMKTTAPNADAVSYDSSSATRPSGAAKEIAASVAPLLGAKFSVKIDARGEVQAVTLSDEAQQALDALPPENQLKQVLSSQGLAQLFRLGGGALPEQAVDVGDTWPATAETETPFGKLSQETKFTLATLSDKEGKSLARITFAAIDKLAANAAAAVKLDVKEQTRSGALVLDVNAGYVREAESQLVSKSVRPFRNQTIQVTVDSKSSLTLERE